MRALARVTLSLGRAFGRLFLPPISLYFLVFGPKARSASAAYLARVFGRPARLWEVYRHFLTFAGAIHDRVLFLAGRTSDFQLSVDGEELIHAALAEHRRGCLLLGAHLGSFESLRAIAAVRRDVRVKILMETSNAVRIDNVLGRIQPGIANWIVPVRGPMTLLTIKECLEREEVVGMLADRVREQERTMEMPFCGAIARFPQGPFRLAATLRVPVIFGVGLFRGGNRYSLHFERLDPFTEARASLPSDLVSYLVRNYVARLEHYCRSAPYNWFNFYPFWDDGASSE